MKRRTPTQVEVYRGLERLISVTPERAAEFWRERYRELIEAAQQDRDRMRHWAIANWFWTVLNVLALVWLISQGSAFLRAVGAG